MVDAAATNLSGTGQTRPPSSTIDPPKNETFWKIFGRIARIGAVVVGALLGSRGSETAGGAVASAIVGAVFFGVVATLGVRAVSNGVLGPDGFSSDKAKAHGLWSIRKPKTDPSQAAEKPAATTDKVSIPDGIDDLDAFKAEFGTPHAPPVRLEQDNVLCSGKMNRFLSADVEGASATAKGTAEVRITAQNGEAPRAEFFWSPDSVEGETYNVKFKFNSTPPAPPEGPAPAETTATVSLSVVRPPIGPLGQQREWEGVKAVVQPWSGLIEEIRQGAPTGDAAELLKDPGSLVTQLSLAAAALSKDHPYKSELEAAVVGLKGLPESGPERGLSMVTIWDAVQTSPELPRVTIAVPQLKAEQALIHRLGKDLLLKVPADRRAAADYSTAKEALVAAKVELSEIDEVHPFLDALDVATDLCDRGLASDWSAGEILEQVQTVLKHRNLNALQAVVGAEAAAVVHKLSEAPANELLVLTATAEQAPLFKEGAVHNLSERLKADIQLANPKWDVQAVRIATAEGQPAAVYATLAAKPATAV